MCSWGVGRGQKMEFLTSCLMLWHPWSHFTFGGSRGHLTHPHQILGHIHQIWQKRPFFGVFRTSIWGNRIIFCILKRKKKPPTVPIRTQDPTIVFWIGTFFPIKPHQGRFGAQWGRFPNFTWFRRGLFTIWPIFTLWNGCLKFFSVKNGGFPT